MEKGPSIARGDLAAVAALAAFVVLLLPDAILRGRVLFDRDLHLLWFGQAQTFVRCVAAGAWPVWNPYPALGQPLLAVPNNEALYPFTWLNLLVQPGPYLTAFAGLHLLAGGLGAYLFARRVSLSRLAAGASGLLWCGAGPLYSLVNGWNHLPGSVLMPWAFLAADRAAESGRIRDACAWGAVIGLGLLAGSPEAAAMGGLGSAVHASRHVLARTAGARGRARFALLAAVAVVFAACLAAVQWLPTLELARHSARARLDPALRSFWSVHPAGMLDAVLPLFLHTWPLTGAGRAALFESRDPFLLSIYLGLPALGLVVASTGAAHRDSWRILAALEAFSLLAALGRHTPVFAALVWIVVPLRAVRYPVKAMTLAALCWALLAGFGVDVWREGLSSPRARRVVIVTMAAAAALAAAAAGVLAFRADPWASSLLAAPPPPLSLADLLRPHAYRLAVSALAAAAVAILAWRTRRPGAARWTAAAAVALAAGDLVWSQRGVHATAPAALYSYRAPVATAILSEPHGRVYTFDYFITGAARKHLGRDAGFVFARPEAVRFPWEAALALRTYAFPTVLAAWGLESAFDRDPTALYGPYAMALAARVREVEDTPAHTRLLRLAGVTHVVALHSAGLEDLAMDGTFESPFPEPIRLFRVPDPFPRTLAVGGARVADGTAALELVADGSFDPRRTVLLSAGGARDAGPGFLGESRIVERRPDRVRVEARLSADGYVVLLDGYDPGWTATVDSRSVEVRRADFAFRAVEVPAGAHQVEFVYRPPLLWTGAVLSALALGVGLAAWAAPRVAPRASAET